MKNLKKLNVLLVEGDKSNAEALKKFIRTNANVDELVLETISEADDVLSQIEKNDVVPHIVILSEPPLNKIKFTNDIQARISQIKKINPASEVIVLATPNKVEKVLETFRSGAYDVILKDEEASKNVVNSIHRYQKTQDEKLLLKNQIVSVH